MSSLQARLDTYCRNSGTDDAVKVGSDSISLTLTLTPTLTLTLGGQRTPRLQFCPLRAQGREQLALLRRCQGVLHPRFETETLTLTLTRTPTHGWT